ncbi:DUF6879 family protein [Couchioplanes caeruleus]|uniref:DUF6879 domain-containing protein n=2 Tax=Couchioplanes caeruleus TaxID=56438 RepID=A0A1K0FNS0_9ACTN|nr:DUF6879 family protein [Couchioplanes caeruleus]OJF14485.1 hypothetical protein BG844_09610 [Couchioplanes caeruleus subsp. caeruleus]ROP21270.1 hypothetical protein EDD30_7666 [Couchioplanes caeruleus]
MNNSMWREIGSGEFFAALHGAARSAFRLELQPAYIEDYEQSLVDRWAVGEFQAPTVVPELADWFSRIGEQTGRGVQVARVRVQEDPPTPYQQFERWCDAWNVGAGETIRYMTRQRALDVGLLPTAGVNGDWWLIDDQQLIFIKHDPDGRRLQYLSTTDAATVSQAATWRDLAIRHSELSDARPAAA